MLKNITNNKYQRMVDHVTMSNNIRDLAIMLLIFTGARSNEILRISFKSIEFVESTDGVESAILNIKASKGSKDRSIPLPIESLARLKSLMIELKERDCQLVSLLNDSSNQIRTAYQLLRRHFNKIQLELFGVIEYSLHAFRHELAHRALDSGMNISQVKVMLGHASMSSTVYYLDSYDTKNVLSKVSNIVKGIAV